MSPRPYLSSYRDRHGRLRWRFRRAGRTIQIHGQPGEPAFEAAYAAALAGQKPATVVKIGSSHIKPRTFKAAWRLVVRTPEWMALRASSREQYIERAERLLAMELPGVPGVTYADAPVVDMRRRHVRELLASMADRPHAAYDTLVVLRKMIAVALDEEWIDVDPTHRVRYRPETDGHRAWTDDERALYERRWPLGTLARTTYALALYTGQRRGDLAAVRWQDVAGETLTVTQQKTGRRLVLPILPVLREALAAAPRPSEFVLSTYAGKPRSIGTLTNDFADWTSAAGLEGCTLHGLRKTLGMILAEEQATTRQLMDVLGHESMQHAELYSRAAEQERMARDALARAEGRLRPRLRVVGGAPIDAPAGAPGANPLKRRGS